MDDLEFLILLIAGAMLFSFVASIVNMMRISGLKSEVRLLRRQLDARTFAAQPEASSQIEDLALTEKAKANVAEVSVSDKSTTQVLKTQPAAIRQIDEQSAEPAKAALAATSDNDTFESKIGGRWAVWLGGLTLGLGGLFLVKYTIESGLLSPAIRLTLAAIFALGLGVAGEFLRRKSGLRLASVPSNVSIPGLLTAAAAITFFGVIYVAYDFYGYIGGTTSFILLALTALATIAISSLHGQSMAGLGLLGAMLAPGLVSSDDPSFVVLFGYLAIAGAAAIFASKKPRWTAVPALAFIGLFVWSVLYLGFAEIVDPLPPAAAFLALIAATIAIWPGDHFEHPEPEPASGTDEDAPKVPSGILGLSLLTRPPLALSATISSTTILTALIYLIAGNQFSFSPFVLATCVITALAALGASRRFAVIPAIFAAGGALAVAMLNGPMVLSLTGENFVLMNDASSIGMTFALAFVFALCGYAFFKKRAEDDYCFALVWAAILALVPAWLGAISFVNDGIYAFDITHFLFGATLGLTALYSADHFASDDKKSSTLAANALVLLSFLSFSLSLHTISAALATTILTPVLGLLYFLAAKRRNWKALPWMMVPALLITMARFAWEPTIVGSDRLWTTPIFNQLLPAYGVAAALALFAAYRTRNSDDLKLKNILQAFAAILSLVFAAVLAHHAMNNGQLIDIEPTLGEQSIYSLLMIGLSAVMLFLDRKESTATLRYGSILVSVLSIITVLMTHIFALNPYFTGELTGSWPLINLILIGYLLPALGYAYIAYAAKEVRPLSFVRFVSATSALLAFVWISLEVRHFWHGASIADWKGFTPSETYSYTVIWILLGVALLVLGIKREALVLRLASALVLTLATAKAFLIDMSNLEGALRALSFIGLGLVLMGIGLFYQKLLSKPTTVRHDESDIAGA